MFTRQTGSVFVRDPKLQPIKERESGTIPNRVVRLSACTKVDRTGKDPLKSIDQPPIVQPVGRQAELFEDLHSRTKLEFASPKANCLSSNPDWNQTILSKRQPKIRVTVDLQEEPSVTPPVNQAAVRRPAQRKAAQEKRPRAEQQWLRTIIPLFTDQFDGPRALLLLLRYAQAICH
jgi:hypothetical protein